MSKTGKTHVITSKWENRQLTINMLSRKKKETLKSILNKKSVNFYAFWKLLLLYIIFFQKDIDFYKFNIHIY